MSLLPICTTCDHLTCKLPVTMLLIAPNTSLLSEINDLLYKWGVKPRENKVRG